MVRRVIGGSIYALSAAIGILAFIYPFFTAHGSYAGMGDGHSSDAPIVTVALVGLALVALLIEMQGRAIGAKTVAMLGVLVAITSVLRFIEVAMPVAGGFSPIFGPIVLIGYVFGGRFGFLMGTFTLLVSGLITGGVGPWLPYQMFTAGWVGMSAGWLGRILRGSRTDLTARPTTGLVVLLSVFGALWGLVYGAIMNIYFWPMAIGPTEQTWSAGMGLGETLARYGIFYAATSLWWDAARALGNAGLILLLGAPVLRALGRFRQRFYFEADGCA